MSIFGGEISCSMSSIILPLPCRTAAEVKHGIEFTPGWNKTERGEWWYVFDQKGTMIKGWFRTMDDWYYLNPDGGEMLSGQWIQVDGKWYYLQRSGLLAREAYVMERDRLCFVDSQGVWDGTYADSFQV